MAKKVWLVVLAMALVIPCMAGAGNVGGKFDVDLYGYLKTDVVYQKGLGVMHNFLVWALPSRGYTYPGSGIAGKIQNKDFDQFGINSVQSRFGFLIHGPEVDGVWSRGRLEADFYGKFISSAPFSNKDPEPNKGSLMLRRATVEFGGDNWAILAGNEWMVMSPIYPHVNNYPYGAEIGNLGYRTPQVRLTLYALDKQLALQVAADNKIGDIAFLDIDTGRASGKPTWEFGVSYNGKLGDNPLKLGVTGHIGVEAIPSLVAGNTANLEWSGREIDTWSIVGHAIVPIGSMITISGEYWQGANLDGWFTGAQGNGWLFDPADHDYEALESTGGWGEIMIKPIKKIDVIGGYGVDDINDDQLEDGTAIIELVGANSKAAITKNEMYYAAINYHLNPAIMISGEWMQVLTEYDFMDATGMTNRYTLAFWFFY